MANKFAADRNQKLLLELAMKPGNDICADCKTRNPRWASHNLGIFICVTCASIHRKIGTHITKVKSLTMDTWTKEQVDRMKEMGNLNSNAIYCPNEIRHPPPPVLMEDERDSELEQYIRSKYEYKQFMETSTRVASKLGPSRSQSTPLDKLKPIPSSSTSSSASSTLPPASTPSIPRTTSAMASTRSASQPAVPSAPPSQPRLVSQPLTSQQLPPRQTSLAPTATTTTAPQANASKGGVWDDLVSLQTPSTSSSLPLQYQQPPVLSFSLSQSTPSMMPQMNGYGMTGMPNNATGMSMGVANTGLGLQPNTFQQQQPQMQFTPTAFPQQQQSFGMNGQIPMFQTQQQQFTNPVQSPQPMFAQQQAAPGQFMPQAQGHSPQPMMTSHTPQMMSTTPQMPQMQGQFTMSPSPQLQQPQFGAMGGMGTSMGMGGGMSMVMGGYPQQQQQQQQQQPMFNQWGQQQQFGGQWGAL
ncbi:arf gap-like zinc finger-containing protein [Moniliophthora roreri MCA 2997]|uniref:Arf gap-like zinc finger-containing protein n=1 Tax=Moniliophthora roreri (strain MCA 2997) TaxID=1381753 RepID=V2X7B0_MONRO|nr:arf gap-like zinc finger-containing protein [Moniliophthora roreri MCA 2997]